MEQKASLGGYLVGFYLFSVPVFSYSGELGLNNIPQIIGAIITLYVVYDLSKSGVLIKSKFLLFYLLFTIWSIITFAFAEHQSQLEGMMTLIKVTIITGSAAILIKSQSDFHVSLSIFFISVFITIVLNYKDITLFSNLDIITDIDRFAGTFANANTAALYCLAIIWSGVTLLFTRNRNIFLNIVILVGIIIAGFIIIYSGSRKGLLGLGFFSIGLAWFLIKKYGYTILRKIIIGMIVLVGIITVFYIIYTSPFFYRVQTMFKSEASSEARIYLFNEALNVWRSSFKNLVMGVGINNFQFHNYLNTYSHSTISETLVCTGIVGFGLYFAGLLSIFSSYLKTFGKLLSDTKTSIIFVLIFLLLVLFFNATGIMYDDRLFLPLMGVISSYGIVLKRTISNIEVNISDF